MARPVRLLEIPLRIAEEAATLDHVSKGRLIFGVGRSGVVKTYEALNIAYSESKDREIECLEIIQRAWREDNFSYKGKFYDIQEVTVVPQPVQQPAPEIRIAAVSVETFPAAGKAGQGLFLSVRHEDVRMFKQHIDVYRKAWTDAGHPGEAPVYLRCPGFVAKTDAAAQEAYGPTLMRHFPRTKAACSPTPLVGRTARRTIRAGKPRSASLKSRSRKHCAVRCSLAHPIRWWAS